MESEVMGTLIESATALATLIGSGTVTAIRTKIQSVKDEKDADKIRAYYDEIISQILQERSEAIMLAQMYKTELEKVVISDEDIEHLQKTIERVLTLFMPMQSENNDSNDTEALQRLSQQQNIETIKGLISADTLKTMQLLGFNYKAAIGEPLTEICANAIRSFGTKGKDNTNTNTKQGNRNNR